MKQSFILITIFMLLAGITNAGTMVLTQKPHPTVAYAGVKENGVSFDVIWTNHLINNTEITIKDKNNDVIYRSTYTESTNKIRFILSKDETQVYTFIVTSGKNRYEQKFMISTAYTETISVDEMK